MRLNGQNWVDGLLKSGFIASGEHPAMKCPGLKGLITTSQNDDQEFELSILAIPENAREGPTDYVLVQAVGYQPDMFLMNGPDPKPSTKIFSLGFPPRSDRSKTSPLVANGQYQDADGSFRISYGTVREPKSDFFYLDSTTIFYSDVDGMPGSSGSVTVNEQGEFVGILQGQGNPQNTYIGCPEGPNQKYCGGIVAHMTGSAITDLFKKLKANP